MPSLRLVATFATSLAAATPLLAQQVLRPIPRVADMLMLVGHGEVSPAMRAAFLHLCGRRDARIAIVATRKPARDRKAWTEQGAREVVVVGRRNEQGAELARKLLDVDGIWFDDDGATLQKHDLFGPLVQNVLARGGAIGGTIGGTVGGAEQDLIARCAVHRPREAGEAATATAGDGRVALTIEPDTALVVHDGRRVGAVGTGKVIAHVAASDGWPERRREVPAQDVFTFGEELPYDLDLLGWLRSARDRQGPAFPPKRPAPPKVPNGTLVLSGGGGVQSPTWRRFIAGAGGKDARIVCIPSASAAAPGRQPSSYSARQLRNHGCSNVVVLHTDDPRRAGQGPLLELLDGATGVWIDGGRTFRLVDAIQFTAVHERIDRILRDGGAVGGSSAGCQVLGQFLVRGNPRTNKQLVFEGYTRGLDLLHGVVLDAHFRDRGREPEFGQLVQSLPQLLGIGVDGDTALVVTGTTAEVLGQNGVTFLNASGERLVSEFLQAGGSYDLVRRRPIR